MTDIELKLCPFCAGRGTIRYDLRDGYETCPDDPDARAYYVCCHGCAATGGWAKCEGNAVRRWIMREEQLEETR